MGQRVFFINVALIVSMHVNTKRQKKSILLTLVYKTKSFLNSFPKVGTFIDIILLLWNLIAVCMTSTINLLFICLIVSNKQKLGSICFWQTHLSYVLLFVMLCWFCVDQSNSYIAVSPIFLLNLQQLPHT